MACQRARLSPYLKGQDQPASQANSHTIILMFLLLLPYLCISLSPSPSPSSPKACGDNPVCGPWLAHDSVITTHTESQCGPLGVYRTEMQIQVPGPNGVIFHLRVGNLQVVVGTNIFVQENSELPLAKDPSLPPSLSLPSSGPPSLISSLSSFSSPPSSSPPFLPSSLTSPSPSPLQLVVMAAALTLKLVAHVGPPQRPTSCVWSVLRTAAVWRLRSSQAYLCPSFWPSLGSSSY